MDQIRICTPGLQLVTHTQVSQHVMTYYRTAKFSPHYLGHLLPTHAMSVWETLLLADWRLPEFRHRACTAGPLRFMQLEAI